MRPPFRCSREVFSKGESEKPVQKWPEISPSCYSPSEGWENSVTWKKKMKKKKEKRKRKNGREIKSNFSRFRLANPFFLAGLLRYFSGNRQDRGCNIYYYATGFCLLPFVDALIIHWALQTLTHVGMKVRVASCALIYRKILKLCNSVFENETSAGQVRNWLIAVSCIWVLVSSLYIPLCHPLSSDGELFKQRR